MADLATKLQSILTECETILATPGASLGPVASKLLSVAQELGLSDESKWLRKELEGYVSGSETQYLGQALQVSEESDLTTTVVKYRLMEGKVYVGAAAQELDYPIFFPEAIPELERRAQKAGRYYQQDMLVKLPFHSLPPGLQKITLQAGISPQPFPVYLPPDSYERVLAGLRGEFLLFVAKARDLVAMKGPEPQNVELRALIITALPVEFLAVQAHLSELTEDIDSAGTVYSVGTFAGWRVWLAEIGAGNVGAAASTERALQHVGPHCVLLVGVAGGLKDVSIGDVVAATKVYAYESGKESSSGFMPRPVALECSYRMVQRAKAEARNEKWNGGSASAASGRALVGPIAAGEKVLASREEATFEILRSQYSDALAVEMEGAGFPTGSGTMKPSETVRFRSVTAACIGDWIEGRSSGNGPGAAAAGPFA